MIAVLRPGPLTTVQDRGRRGLGAFGVPPSGAADGEAFALANRLVGNPPAAAALEITLSGPKLRFETDALIVLTGATVEAGIGPRELAMNTPTRVRAGSELDIGPTSDGLRAYLAIRGGIDAPQTLGSRSRDVLTPLGPRPLRRGDRIAVGDETEPLPAVGVAPVAPLPRDTCLRVVLGPRNDWFTAAAVVALTTRWFTVGHASNRIGVRLEGPKLERARRDELLSEGVVTGSLQVPANGSPILLLNDHPTTGGYPVIAVVVSDDLSLAAQLRPGQRVRFRAVSPG